MKHRSIDQLVAILFCSMLAVLCAGATTWAQEERGVPPESPLAEEPPAAPQEGDVPAEPAAPAPAQNLDKWNDAHSIPRSSRPLLSWPKLLGVWILFLIWVRSVDFVNRDSQIHELGYGKWNAIVFFPFFAVLFLVVFRITYLPPIPANFIVSVILLSLAWLATFVPYVVVRNRAVERHERVFTADWFRYEFAFLANKVGIKVAAERKADYEKGAPVELVAMGSKDDRVNQANLITARQSPGYLTVKELIAHMADQRSDKAILDYTQQAVTERLHIDGVWHNGEARDRESGDVMLAVMKTLANLDMTERRKKQSGSFAAKYKGMSFVCPLVSQGVKTGERVALDLVGGHRDELKTFNHLGMREKLAEEWAALMFRDQGLLVISGLPEGGVTTLTDVSLMETDRLMRDFISIEDEQHRERDIENVEVTTYNSAEGGTPKSVIVPVIRKYPNVIVLRDLTDAETAKMLFAEVRDERLLITNVYAKDAAEALLRMLQKKVPQRDFASLVTAVINTRLIRKLCDDCKVAYEPTPDLLKKLGIPAGKVKTLYRTPKPEEVDKPCPKCAGIGYYGRTGLFELLVVDDKIREILVKQPQLALLQKAARAAGMRTLQEEGILILAKGVTSIQELQRVLQQ